MDKLIGFLGVAILGLAFIFLLAFILAWITQWAWSGSVAQIFHLTELTYWQAYCLNVLGGMLCKNSSVSKS
jgi:hypothetical protein